MNTSNLEQTSLGLAAKPALLVVDVINGFTDPACPLGTHCPEVITANFQLLEIFRAKALPIFLPQWSITMTNKRPSSELKCLRLIFWMPDHTGSK